MIIHPRHFVRFIDGRASDHVVIAFLPGHLGAHIGTLQTDVRLRRDYALKLLAKRIGYHGFEEIQNTIDKGWCIKEDEFHLTFVYMKTSYKPEYFFLALKTDRKRSELWLVTFFRMKHAQVRRRLKAGPVIRPHESEWDG